MRKVQPLRAKLATLTAWVTGQRKDQSPGTRNAVPVCQVDPVFEGASGGAGSLVKFNPLTDATSQEVWDFLRVMGTPVNELHERGYVSIGCAPCTRAVLPGQQEREGRWWWEDATAKECGLHSGNLTADEKAKQDDREATEEDIFEHNAVHVLSHDDIDALKDEKTHSETTLAVLYAPWCPHCQRMVGGFEAAAERLTPKGVKFAKFRADRDEKEWAKENLSLNSFPTLLLFPKGRSGSPSSAPSVAIRTACKYSSSPFSESCNSSSSSIPPRLRRDDSIASSRRQCATRPALQETSPWVSPRAH